MKRALIIHGWGSGPKKKWFHREKLRLEKLGYEVTIPQMPGRYFPNKKKWLAVIAQFAPDKDSALIGQSLGGTLILDYLERAQSPVSYVVLSATPIAYISRESLASFLHTLVISTFVTFCGYRPIKNWAKISNNATKLELVYKKLDFRGPRAQGEYLSQKLGCKCIELRGKDHMDKINLDIVNEEIS